MKHIIVVLISISLIIALSSCGSDEKSDAEIKKEEQAKAKQEIYIDDYYKTQKAFGYRFKIPKELTYNEEASKSKEKRNDKSKYFDGFNDSGIVTDRIYFEKKYLGEIEIDKAEALEFFTDAFKKEDSISNVGENDYITVAGEEAISVTFNSNLDGLKFKCKYTSWIDDDNNMFMMSFLTSRKSLNKYKYVLDTIIKEPSD